MIPQMFLKAYALAIPDFPIIVQLTTEPTDTASADHRLHRRAVLRNTPRLRSYSEISRRFYSSSHAGRPMRFLPGILVVAAILAAPRPVGAQSAGVDARADALVSRWADGLGGPSVWSRLRDLRYTATTVWYDTATGKETRRRPRYIWMKRTRDGWNVRVERTEMDGKYVQVWDGQRGWATLRGEALPDTARAVQEIEYVAGDLTYWVGLPWKLRDPGVNLDYSPGDSIGTGQVVPVTFGSDVGLHPRDRFWWYFGDVASRFPTEVHYIEQDRTVRDRARLIGWVTSGPFPFVRWRIYYDEHGRVTKAIRYSDFQPNRGVSPRLFRSRR
jgi:hypothetical protein